MRHRCHHAVTLPRKGQQLLQPERLRMRQTSDTGTRQVGHDTEHGADALLPFPLPNPAAYSLVVFFLLFPAGRGVWR